MELQYRLLACYLLAINVATLITFGIDKLKAKRAKWRIPEATLPAEVTALPVPKGSQAKPHVAITVGGETICEIGARSWDYTNLASLVGMRGGVRLQRWVSRYEDDDDGYYYVIDLIR